MDAAKPLPEPLDAAVASGSGETNSRAVDLLVSLARQRQSLTPSEIQAILSFISTPKPGDLTDGEWEERVNVILNLLRQQSSVPGLTEYLLGTAEKHPSRILRLYAMQHLAFWYQRESSEEKRSEIVALLVTLAEKAGEETAGSAVMFLNDLQREVAATGGEVANDQVIGRAALRLAADRGAKQDVRISALHTCVERKMAGVLPAAREIAADPSAVIPLRKAAIFSIGQLGTADDQTLLDKLGSDTPDLRPATGPALAKLRAGPS